MRPLLVLVGATGTGKSALAVRLALDLGGEVIGADAFQVYRRLDIGTGKTPPSERLGVPHHLLDVADPGDDYSLGRYVREAEAAIAGIRARGRLPIVAGGTGMYVRGLVRGVFEGPARDPALRERLRGIAARRGGQGLRRLHFLLRRADPAAALRIHPTDRQRILRAIEVCLRAGRPISQMQTEWESGAERHPAVLLGLRLPRPELHRRIEERIAAMWDGGLVEEVRGLLASGVDPACNAFHAIGYREIACALRGEIPLREARQRMIAATRQYAKRQETWFRRERGIAWIEAGLPPGDLAREARNRYEESAAAVVDSSRQPHA